MLTVKMNVKDLRRLHLDKNLDPELQALIPQLKQLWKQACTGCILGAYDVGAILSTISDDEPRFGFFAVEQVGIVLDVEASWLYELAAISLAYSRTFLESVADRGSLRGRCITVGDLLSLMRIPDEKDRVYWVERVLREELTPTRLYNRMVEAGAILPIAHRKGRHLSPVEIAVGKLLSMARAINRQFPIWQAEIHDKFDSLPASQLNRALLAKLCRGEAQMAQLRTTIRQVRQRLQDSIRQLRERIAPEEGWRPVQADHADEQ